MRRHVQMTTWRVEQMVLDEMRKDIAWAQHHRFGTTLTPSGLMYGRCIWIGQHTGEDVDAVLDRLAAEVQVAV